MEPWGNNSLNQLIHPNMDSSCGNATTYCLGKVPVQVSQAQRIWGDPLSVGFASHTVWGCSQGMPWWGRSFKSGVHAQSYCNRFYWPHMAAQAKEHIRKCCTCLAFKAKQPKAPLENIVATHPLELVHLNYLCLEPGKGLEKNVLVVTDHFTRYA